MRPATRPRVGAVPRIARWLGVVVALILGGLNPVTASGNTYRVVQCDATLNPSTSEFSVDDGAGYGHANDCSGTGGSMQIFNGGGATVPNGSNSNWKFTAPAATTITAVTIVRADLEDRDGHHAEVLVKNGATENVFAGGTSAGGFTNYQTDQNGDAFKGRLRCAAASGCPNPSGDEAHMKMKSIKIQLSDAADPVPGTSTGSLVTGSVVGGTKSIAVSGSDRGGGVRTLAVQATNTSTNAVTSLGTWNDGSCQLTSDGESKVAVPCTAGGVTVSHTFSANTAQLADGNYKIQGCVADLGEPTASSLTCETGKTMTVDNHAPAVSITNGPSGPTASQQASFSFTAPEAGVSYQCQLDTSAWAGCTSPRSYSSLSQGAHTFNVRALDSLGNVGASTDRSWIVDTQAPVILLSGALKQAVDTGTSLTAAKYGLTASATEGRPDSGGVVRLDMTSDLEPYEHAGQDCPQGGCSLSRMWQYYTTAESQGPHSVVVTAWDAAGNTVKQEVAFTVANAGPCAPPSSASSSDPSVLTAPQATAQIDATDPSLAAPSTPSTVDGVPVDPTLNDQGNELRYADAGVQGEIQKDPECGFSYVLGDDFPVVFIPTSLGPDATQPDVAHGDSAVFANTSQSTDTVVRPLAPAVGAFAHIRDSRAPTSLSWAVVTPGDEDLEAKPDGTVDIVATVPGDPIEADGEDSLSSSDLQQLNDSSMLTEPQFAAQPDPGTPEPPDRTTDPDERQVVGTLRAPSATATNGVAVPAALTVSGDTLTATIQHAGAQYPVIAKPIRVTRTPVQVQLAPDHGDDNGDAIGGEFYPAGGGVTVTADASTTEARYDDFGTGGGTEFGTDKQDDVIAKQQQSWQCNVSGPSRPIHIDANHLHSYGQMACTGTASLVTKQRLKVCVEHRAHYLGVEYWPNDKCDSDTVGIGKSTQIEDVTAHCHKGGTHYRGSDEGYIYTRVAPLFPVYKTFNAKC
jgi:hypothetical protein